MADRARVPARRGGARHLTGGRTTRARCAIHDDQLAIDVGTVRSLLAEQLPELADRPVVPVVGGGTVNAVFRVGEELVARLPLRRGDPLLVAAALRREGKSSAEFADAVAPVPAPRPVAMGAPGRGYPLPWSVQTWVPGETSSSAEPVEVARGLAAVLRRLRRRATGGASFSGTGRGGDLRSHDDWVGTCLSRSGHLVDVREAGRLWDELRELPRTQPDVVTHADLVPGNVLVRDGRLVGLLDTGGSGPADPALDTIAAWHLFDEGPRRAFRAALDCDDLEWQRSRAWALEQALGAAWYYEHPNPAILTMGVTTLRRVLRG